MATKPYEVMNPVLKFVVKVVVSMYGEYQQRGATVSVYRHL